LKVTIYILRLLSLFPMISIQLFPDSVCICFMILYLFSIRWPIDDGLYQNE
jgi:hypothetical protein